MAGIQSYKLGDWQLESGQSIPDAQMAYKTFGDPTSPAIIYPSWFSGCMLGSSFHITYTDIVKQSPIMSGLLEGGTFWTPKSTTLSLLLCLVMASQLPPQIQT